MLLTWGVLHCWALCHLTTVARLHLDVVNLSAADVYVSVFVGSFYHTDLTGAMVQTVGNRITYSLAIPARIHNYSHQTRIKT